MTEYEMAYLANEYRGSIGTSAGMAFTTVSAFLAAGCLAAHNLNRLMVITVTVIYSVWLWGAVFNLVRTAMNLDGLAQQMRLMAEQGQGLRWHLAADAVPQWAFPATLAGTLFVFALIYVASVVFFFQSRRQNRKVEIAAGV